MKRPEFITFTGVDEHTSIDGLLEIASLYPVEFGVLVSAERSLLPEETRYPSNDWIESFSVLMKTKHPDVRIAAHICGSLAREITGDKPCNFTREISQFSRIQVNTSYPKKHELLRAAALADICGVELIFQTRDRFPYWFSYEGQLCRWLYDTSGGRGKKPKAWISSIDGPGLIGYAGGIGPDNVAEIVAIIGGPLTPETGIGPDQAYWIDMESGVRTEDRFDLAKVWAVCETVYGPRP